MKKLLGPALALPMCVQAGGFEREAQMPGYLFEKGTYAELQVSLSSPTVDGTLQLGPTEQKSGDVFLNHHNTRLAFKAPISSRLDWSIAYLEPFGTDVAYRSSDSLYPYTGSFARVDVKAITTLMKYELSETFSIYGGGKFSEYDGSADVNVSAPMDGVNLTRILDYQLRSEKDQSAGYVLGAAFQIPDIALRVALTYNSEVEHSNAIVESASGVDVVGGSGPFAIPDSASQVKTTLPASVNLSFQTGITPKTLLFGFINWVDWTSSEMTPTLYAQVSGGNSLIRHKDDAITYDLGVGRRFSDTLSLALSYRTEQSTGKEAASLSPTDGYDSLTLSANFTDNRHKTIKSYVSLVEFGDTYVDEGGQRTDFKNNDSIVFGMTFGYSF